MNPFPGFQGSLGRVGAGLGGGSRGTCEDAPSVLTLHVPLTKVSWDVSRQFSLLSWVRAARRGRRILSAWGGGSKKLPHQRKCYYSWILKDEMLTSKLRREGHSKKREQLAWWLRGAVHCSVTSISLQRLMVKSLKCQGYVGLSWSP